MILQRLSEYYDRSIRDPALAGELPRRGYSFQKIGFCVVVNPDGTLNGIQSMMEEGSKRLIPRRMLVLGGAKPSGSRINPCFLWDNSAYMLGFKEEDTKPDRTRDCFAKFRTRHLEIASRLQSDSLDTVVKFLENWNPALVLESDELRGTLSHFGVFRVKGEEAYVHEDKNVVDWWEGEVQGQASGPTSECLVSGKRRPISRIHSPKIKGVGGAQSSGALLVSFNDAAYGSFGKEQSANAPVGSEIVFKYANGLNHLLHSRKRRVLNRPGFSGEFFM